MKTSKKFALQYIALGVLSPAMGLFAFLAVASSAVHEPLRLSMAVGFAAAYIIGSSISGVATAVLRASRHNAAASFMMYLIGENLAESIAARAHENTDPTATDDTKEHP